MTYRKRIKYNAEQKAVIWDKYKQGESLWSIARTSDRSSSCIYGLLSPTGGIRPPERKRSRLALSLAEREEISRGIVANHSIRAIAAQLARSPSTISREISRNGGYAQYRATQADQNAWDNARRPKRCKLAMNPRLSRIIGQKLKRK
jgi:transposase